MPIIILIVMFSSPVAVTVNCVSAKPVRSHSSSDNINQRSSYELCVYDYGKFHLRESIRMY